MKRFILGLACSVAALTIAGAIPAQAAGCIKGAAVGAVAGHVAGHHAVLGAAAGCVVGHHEAAVHRRQAEAAQRAQPAQTPTSTSAGATVP